MDAVADNILSLADERRERLKTIASVGSRYYSFPLYLAFWAADLVFVPEHKWLFLALRLSVIPCLVLGNLVIRRVTTLRAAQLCCSFLCIANGVPIIAMLAVLGNPNHPYYVGLMLVIIGMGTFIRWTHAFFLANVVGITLPYVVLGLVSWPTLDGKLFFLSLFFVFGTVLITAVVHSFSEEMYRREYDARRRLHEEVASRGKIIETKTKEAVYLSQLTKQFSPQVLHAVREGALDIARPLHEADICAIFIDIVDSTERVLQLDRVPLSKVLTMYMEDTMSILLKYDITIDKFLGDGVLGFSNDPISHNDYVERVLLAAVQIRARLHARQLAYNEHWQREFRVRMGIASGKANVGFYGHEDFIRSYTAIGRPVNLAARLSNAAQPNEILVSGDVAKTLRGAGAEATLGIDLMRSGPVNLKGFETGTIEVLSVSQHADPAHVPSEVSSCPQGHGILYLDTNDKGLFVFRCRVCNYEDAANPEDEGKKMAA